MNRKEIKLVILDVDGVLADGKIICTSDTQGENAFGGDIKAFCAKDGFFIKHICKPMGIKFAIISGSESSAIQRRADMLNFDYVYRGAMDKEKAYFDLKEKCGLEDDEIAYMGDDWFDWPVMKYVGYKGVPADGEDEIKVRADFIARRNGGEGAVRDFLEEILKINGKFEEAKKMYLD